MSLRIAFQQIDNQIASYNTRYITLKFLSYAIFFQNYYKTRRLNHSDVYIYHQIPQFNEQSARRDANKLLADCSKAEPNIFAPSQTPVPGAQDGQNLISWR